MAVHRAVLLVLSLLGAASAQLAGKSKPEVHPPMPMLTCTLSGGCTPQATSVTMDAQWRWTHNAAGNCIAGATWSSTTGCMLEGMDASQYETTYGVSTIPGGIQLKFKNGPSIGSRLYMMEDVGTYKMFKLLNKEFTIDVDVSTLECGLNGAVYFVEMAADGGLGTGTNTAGAKYGTGYCDAQCPHDLKFIKGHANSKDWHMTKTGPVGHFGSCCSEMDIWEANFASTAYTAHPCHTPGPMQCEGLGRPAGIPNACGDTPDDCKCCDTPETCPCCGRYKGVCDKDGCDFNSYRLGNKTFYGKGPGFTIDATKPITIVTQFVTSDGTDTGDLTEIRRLYVQDGRVIKNSIAAGVPGLQGDSLTDTFCAAQKTAFDNPDDFGPKGGLKEMGKALGRGMVLVLSLWDDELTKMNWLDSKTPDDKPETTPGVVRGPCSVTAGDPATLRSQHGDAFVKYSNIMVGEIGSTYGPKAQQAKASLASMVASPAGAVGAPLAAQPQPVQPVQPVQPIQPAQPVQPVQPVQAVQPVQPVQPVGTQPVATQPMAAQPVVVQPWVQPVAAQPAAGQPAAAQLVAAQPAVAQPAAAGGGVCCTSGKNAGNKCASCWPGSDVRTGFCAQSQANCGGCGGAWCGSSVTMALFEKHSAPIQGAVESRLSSFAARACAAAALLSGLAAAAAIALRAGPWRRLSMSSQAELAGLVTPQRPSRSPAEEGLVEAFA